MSDGVRTGGSTSSVSTSVSLSKGRGGTVGKRVKSGWVGSIGFTLGERVVSVVSGHDPFTSHLVQGVLTLNGGGNSRVFGGTDSETELSVRHVVHPLFVMHIGTRDVGGDITTDGVTKSGSTVGVELSSLITAGNVDLGEITETLDLNVKRSLDVVDSGESTIWDDTSIVSSLDTPSDFLSLSVTDNRVGVGRTEQTEIIDGVQREQSGVGSLVDGCSQRG